MSELDKEVQKNANELNQCLAQLDFHIKNGKLRDETENAKEQLAQKAREVLQPIIDKTQDTQDKVERLAARTLELRGIKNERI